MGTGFSDDVSHILLGSHHGRCVRVIGRGLEIRALEDAKPVDVGSGCESFGGVLCTGFVDGD